MRRQAWIAPYSACTVIGTLPLLSRWESQSGIAACMHACRHMHATTITNAMAVCTACAQLFREALLAEDFQEIHTPKLIAGASEGGAAVSPLVPLTSCPSCVRRA